MPYLEKAFLVQFNKRELCAAVDEAADFINNDTMKRTIVDEVKELGYKGPHMDSAWAVAMRSFTGKIPDFKMFEEADFCRRELLFYEKEVQRISGYNAAESQVQSRVWDRFFNKVFTNLETVREKKNEKGPKKE